MKEDDYALGYSGAELHRLTTQAKLIDPITRRFFLAAGIAPGMRVLDIGSGAGDVALLCSDITGPTGEVVGTDLSQASVDVATRRARSAGKGNITFKHGNPAVLEFEQPFDAVVGRYVLQFLPEPAAFLRQIVRHVRPGGIVVFHELDWDGARSSPASPTYDKVCGWLSKSIAASGAQVRLGAGLANVFEHAGLPTPVLRLEAVIGSGTQAAGAARLVVDLVETQMPAIIRHGIATESEIQFPTLMSRILDDVGASGTLIGRSEVGAWTNKLTS